MKFHRSRKGEEGREIILLVMYLLFCGVGVMIYMFLVAELASDSTDYTAVIAKGQIQKALFSPHGIIYSDPQTGRALPGVIDINSLSSERLQAAISPNTEQRYPAMYIAYYELEADGNTGGLLGEAFVQQEDYFLWKEREGLLGLGGTKIFRNQYVLPYFYQFEGELRRGTGVLYQEVVIPNDFS